VAWSLEGRLKAGLALVAATPIAAAMACSRDATTLAVLGAVTLAAILCALWITRGVFALLVRTRREMLARQAELDEARGELERLRTLLSQDLGPQAQVIDGFTRVLETAYASQLDREALRILAKMRASAVVMRRAMDEWLPRSPR
jgi:hypothetical protein